ncbi:energy transducer TonB [Emcibacter sp.]|uniref:energy transducer TonB n=1 Tax=Emcibacter sp. TaxID=1979954 RepID=UPI003A911F37
MTNPKKQTDFSPDLPGTGFAVRPAELILAASPKYPVRALQSGKEGYVVVGYNIDKNGRAITPYVIESSNKIFENTALRAVTNFKYKQKFLNGRPVM